MNTRLTVPTVRPPQTQWLGRICWLEPVWVTCIGGVLLFSEVAPAQAWYPLLLVALFAFWPLQMWRQRQLGQALITTPLSIGIWVLVCCFPLAVEISIDRARSWQSAGFLLFGIALWSAIVHWVPFRRHVACFTTLLILCGPLLALGALPFTVWKPEFRLYYLPFYSAVGRLSLGFADTIHANVLAGALVLLWPMSLAYALGSRAPSPLSPSKRLEGPATPSVSVQSGVWRGIVLRTGAAVAAVVVAFVILLTQSRAAYLGLAAALLFLLMWRWPSLRWLLLPVAAIIILAVGLGAGLPFMAMLGADNAVGGLEERAAIWSAALSAVHDFPLTGIGLGAFPVAIPLLYPLRVAIDSYPHAHNLFLQIAVDLGVPGLLSFAATLLGAVALLVPLLTAPSARHESPDFSGPAKARPAGLARVAAAGAMGGLIAMSMQGLLDAAVWNNRLSFVPWLLFAEATLIFLSVSRERNNPPQLYP